MIILLVASDVLNEVLEWARLRIAKILVVDPLEVRGEWVKNDKGLLDAKFDLDATKVVGVSQDQVQDVIKSVWVTEARAMLDERLAGVKQRRG